MHTFKNFKNFADAEIDLSKPMTLLIGRNGSGKSNVIEGVELLAELIKGRALNDISDVGRSSNFEIRGGIENCISKNNLSVDSELELLKKLNRFQLGFYSKISFEEEKINFFYNIDIRTSGIPQVAGESVAIDDEFFFRAMSTENNGVLSVSQNIKLNQTSVSSNKEKFFPANISVYSDYAKLIRFIDIDDKLIKKFKFLFYMKKYIESVFIFDIHPRSIRNYERIGQSELTKNGSNISSVLYSLKENNPDILKQILERIRQLPEEFFVDFEFITTSANDVIFAFKHEDGTIIDARLLSDGTLRALAILTALETVPEGSRIIIEEIDNGVHASRVHVLIDAIWEASNRRNLNTLITTHNPATLDSLNDEQLECVVVCHYDKQSQSAKLTPFFELPRVGVLLQKGKLGGLVTRNVIERYLDPDSAQERKKLALESLEDCR